MHRDDGGLNAPCLVVCPLINGNSRKGCGLDRPGGVTVSAMICRQVHDMVSVTSDIISCDGGTFYP
jgi:hypothetical protein